eukprot:7004083-Pyramimonas_sp.AAC.2
MTWGSFNDKEDQAWEQMDALWYDNAYCRRLIVRRINVNLFRTRISGHAKKVSSADAGVNFFDTAELYPVAFNYGKTTEVWMGNWMQKRIAEGKFERSKIYIATKVNPMGIGCPLDDRAGKPHSYDKEVVFASCKGSLERLKTDYIDLYQFHWPSRDTPIFGTPLPFPSPSPPSAIPARPLHIKAPCCHT